MRIQLPKDKFDVRRVNKLSRLNKEKLVPLYPQLLLWLQDINWPVAKPVAKLLRRYPDELVPHIKDIMKSDDYFWQFSCYVELVAKLPLEYVMLFEEELQRLVSNPNQEEKLEALDDIASEILIKLKG